MGKKNNSQLKQTQKIHQIKKGAVPPSSKVQQTPANHKTSKAASTPANLNKQTTNNVNKSDKKIIKGESSIKINENSHVEKPIVQEKTKTPESFIKNSEPQQSSKPQKSTAEQLETKGKPWSQLQYSLREELVQSLKKCNFHTMMPVQQASIPLLLKNYDLAVQAQTGSGKTLSFLTPLLEKYLATTIPSGQKKNDENETQQNRQFRPVIRYLVVSPTRELCQQTFNVLSKLLQNIPSKERSEKYLKYCHCATGGSDMATDIQKLKQSTIVFVGTVGRIRQLSEHMDQNWLKKVEYLFIDEADRVLKEKGIEQLIRSVQKIRRTAMFSATLQTLNQKNYQFYGMRNLAKISLKQSTTNPNANNSTPISNANEDKKYIIPKSLTNTYLVMPSRIQKMEFLTNFLRNQISQAKVIVFFNTCASVDFYTKLFNAFFNFKEQEQIVGLHGKLKTKRRQKLIKTFLNKPSGCLFATDVVSRGIDFDHIHFIVQVDPPQNPDNYVHRIGRTARINRPGTAILLIEEHEEAFINYLAQKSVGVQLISDPKLYYSKSDEVESITEISQQMDQIMRTDRDFVEKSKKAFVSYIRSYKEHDLRYIFEFKNLDIGTTAHSFFMYRIPRIKEILGKSIASFTQSTVDIETIPWLDKNQQLQYLRKKQKREQELNEKKKLERKILKNADAKNNKSKRKRIKAELTNKNQSIINKQHRQILKQKISGSKKGKNHQKDFDSEEQSSIQDSEDTEQIEQRFQNKDDQAAVKGQNKAHQKKYSKIFKKH